MTTDAHSGPTTEPGMRTRDVVEQDTEGPHVIPTDLVSVALPAQGLA